MDLFSRLRQAHADMRNERGAETVEVIIFLVIIVVGLTGAWFALRNALSDNTDRLTECINDGTNAEDC